MKENLKYHITKQLVEHGGNKQRAALALGCSRRTLDRYILGYKTQGKGFFIQPPFETISLAIRIFNHSSSSCANNNMIYDMNCQIRLFTAVSLDL